jgi:hypothetical protein
MTQIKSKIHTYGDEKESSWPSQFGTGQKGIFHVDAASGEVRTGYPPSTDLKFGTAPIVMFDSMPAEYHEGACRIIESRDEWRAADRYYGNETFGSREEISRITAKGVAEERRRLAEDRRHAALEARTAYRENPTQVEQRLVKEAEQQIETLKESGIKIEDIAS